MQNDYLADCDFSAHNAEVRRIWAAFHEGKPERAPMVLGVNPRFLLCNPEANVEGVDFEAYSEKPDVMFDSQLRFQRWIRHNLLQDAELGMPESWAVYVDFQNYYEAAWFGCPVEYRDGQVPDAVPVYADAPERVMEGGIPDPFSGIMGRSLEYGERFVERAASERYMDRPIFAHTPGTGMGTDGPMTVACSLFGATFVCETLAADPQRMARLLEFVTDAIIARMEAWRRRHETPFPQDGFGMADDSIALLAPRAYREYILPLHRRIYDRFGTQVGRGIHLCGDATRHFVTIRDELAVASFDTGFPVDFADMRRRLGPSVLLHGGPSAALLVGASPDEVRAESRRILQSGVLEGGRFIFREGNNLAPNTPLDNVAAMYESVRASGQIPQ